MGINKKTAQRLYEVFSHMPTKDKEIILTLGKQDIYLTPTNMRELTGRDTVYKVNLSRKPTLRDRGYIDDITFFRWAGGFSSILSIDISQYEGADQLVDICRAHPFREHDVVLDVGTLEHTRDPWSALLFMQRSLRYKGKIIQLLPSDGYMNHGYYQISPKLLRDFWVDSCVERQETTRDHWWSRRRSTFLVAHKINTSEPVGMRDENHLHHNKQPEDFITRYPRLNKYLPTFYDWWVGL